MKTFKKQKKCFKGDPILDWEPAQVLKGGGDVFVCEYTFNALLDVIKMLGLQQESSSLFFTLSCDILCTVTRYHVPCGSHVLKNPTTIKNMIAFKGRLLLSSSQTSYTVDF